MQLLFDIGYTKMRFALSRDGQSFSEPEIVDTPTNKDEALAVIKGIASHLSLDPITMVVGGITRKHQDFGPEIKKLFSCPVYIENDTALVGLGEATAGAGRGSRILVYITISSGVGGVRIVNGKIDPSASGFEPGHHIIDYKEPTKHFEDYISGLSVQAATGKHPREITDQQFWQDIAKTAAVGIHNVMMHWSPDRIVFGGSMMKVPGISVDDLKQELAKISTVFPTLPELQHASLGDIGGLHGALALARQKS